MGEQSTDIDGLKMVYSVDGDESLPPLVMIHGWGSFKGVWQTTIPALKSKYRCIAVDLIGFGDSDIPPQVDVTIPTQAGRIVKLIDELGYDRVTLMGHSMGGQIALYLASQLISDRVDKLINVSGVSHAQLTPAAERELWVLKLAQTIPLMFTMTRLWCHTSLYARIYCSHWFYDSRAVDADFFREARYRIVQPDAHHAMYPSWEALTSCDLTAYLPQITAPTLTIFGKQDNVVPVEAGQIVNQHVPAHQLILIDECGHFPMYEQTEIYIDAIKGFLDI